MKRFTTGLFGIFATWLLFYSPVFGDIFLPDLPYANVVPQNSHSFSLLEQAPSSASEKKGSIRPNAHLSKRGDLGTICFSPVDTVTHYVGATLGSASEALEPSVQGEKEQLREQWTLQFGVGVERQLSKRATFDLDYRFTSSPLELDLETLRQIPGDGHSISAGMKILF